MDQFQINRLRFTGVISSGAANEYVAVMHRRCGQPSFTAIGGATTGEGGAWEAIPMFGTPPTSGTFRAQWKGEVSEPVTLRSAVRISLNRPRSGRHVVSDCRRESQRAVRRPTAPRRRPVGARPASAPHFLRLGGFRRRLRGDVHGPEARPDASLLRPREDGSSLPLARRVAFLRLVVAAQRFLLSRRNPSGRMAASVT